MNQAKKRLTIIKLAISMTDTETIQLQVLKLGLLKTDNKIKEILTFLNAQNYVQAQKLIAKYIDSPNQTTVIQRISQEKLKDTLDENLIEKKESIKTDIIEEQTLHLKAKIQQAKDQALIDQSKLFFHSSNAEEKTSNKMYDDNFHATPTSTIETISYDTLLNVNAEDVLPDNITLDISTNTNIHSIDEAFFSETNEILPHTQKDDLFNQEEIYNKTETEKNQDIQSSFQSKDAKKCITKETMHYKAISYIKQKFRHMSNQYPPVQNSNIEYTSVNKWLLKISDEGYLESEIEKIIENIEELVSIDKAEAAQLLLIAGATESKYAQFRLARALYKGELLERNIDESFILINRLALNDNYPEAICDLAQFYESGIGTSKDKHKAKELYKEAMELGISRAENHYKRLDASNNSLFSLFKK